MTTTDKLAAALQALANRYVLANPSDHAGAEMTAARDALAEFEAAPKGWTIGIREGNATGTTHVSYHEAATVEEAIEQAKAETREDWGQEEEEGVDDLHVLCVLVGDVTVEQWDDGWE